MAFDRNIVYPTTLPSRSELLEEMNDISKVLREVDELDAEYDRMTKLREEALLKLKEKGDKRNKMIYELQKNIVLVQTHLVDTSYFMMANKKDVDDLHKQARKLGFGLSFYPSNIWDSITSGVNVIGMVETKEEILDKLKRKAGSNPPAKKYKQTK